MSGTTQYYDLSKPNEGDNDWADEVNDNWDAIDTQMKVNADGKADKVSGATSGNFASLDVNGNLEDSGRKHADYEASGSVASHESSYDHDKLHTRKHYIDGGDDHNGVGGAVEDNLMSFNASGLPKDSGKAASAVHTRQHDIDATADHNGVGGAVEDNLVSFDANGLPQDSGIADGDVPRTRDAWVNVVISGGGSDVSTGQVEGEISLPACTITGVRILSPDSGSIKIDLWVDSYANFPPTNADSICGGNEPELSAASKYEDTTLTDWTIEVTAGDVLLLNVDSCSGIESCTLGLKIQI